VVYLDGCKKCGAAVFAGTKYCRDCAADEDDWHGYTDITEIPDWALYVVIAAEAAACLWIIGVVIKRFM